MSSITVKWDDNASTSEKMERLMVQKWIALFPDGQEAWSEIRRTGYPKVFPSAQSTAYDLTVPNHGAGQQSRQLSESRAAARRS